MLPVENLWQGWAGLQVCRHSCRAFHPSEFRFLPCLSVSADCLILEEKSNEKSTPFGVNEMRSQVLNRTAQGVLFYIRCTSSGETCIIWLMIC